MRQLTGAEVSEKCFRNAASAVADGSMHLQWFQGSQLCGLVVVEVDDLFFVWHCSIFQTHGGLAKSFSIWQVCDAFSTSRRSLFQWKEDQNDSRERL